MKNKRSFKLFEVIVVILLLMFVGSFFLNSILNNQKNIKFVSFKKDINRFYQVVSSNIASFHNNQFVYLQEVIDEEFLKEIKNPIQRGSCDSSESKVEYIDYHPFVSLKCGDYLIDKQSVQDTDHSSIYKVSDWSLNKINKDSIEEKILYNCNINGKDIFPKYYEEFYLIYLINKKYKKNYYSISEVESNVCRIVNKTFYRIKEIVKE